ncbi:MAG: hypothetical protein JWR38_283 [Mucilaginibacter sp.]|nr:hypothetical protein [Mucilaginibacter sp.]
MPKKQEVIKYKSIILTVHFNNYVLVLGIPVILFSFGHGFRMLSC